NFTPDAEVEPDPVNKELAALPDYKQPQRINQTQPRLVREDPTHAVAVHEVRVTFNLAAKPEQDTGGPEHSFSALLTSRRVSELEQGEVSQDVWDLVASLAKEVVYKDYIENGQIFNNKTKPHHWKIFWLFFAEDLSVKEICAQLDLDEKKVISIKKSAVEMVMTKQARDPDFKRKLRSMWDPRNADDPMTDQFAEEVQLALDGDKILPGADRLRTLWAELDDDYEA